MNKTIGPISTVLVVEDVEETRDDIEKLLKADGYEVLSARDVEDAIDRAARQHPNLILIAAGVSPLEVVAVAHRIRVGAGLGEDIPVVIVDQTRILQAPSRNCDTLPASTQHVGYELLCHNEFVRLYAIVT